MGIEVCAASGTSGLRGRKGVRDGWRASAAPLPAAGKARGPRG